MKPKELFMEMFNNLPEEAKTELVFNPYSSRPMTLQVCALEVKANTRLGQKILNKLGYKWLGETTSE